MPASSHRKLQNLRMHREIHLPEKNGTERWKFHPRDIENSNALGQVDGILKLKERSSTDTC